MNKSIVVLLLPTMFGLISCGTVNNALVGKTKVTEYYQIYDIKTDAPYDVMADVLSSGVGKNINNATETRPIPDSQELPEKPGRFKIVDALKSMNGMEGLMALGGASLQSQFKSATCDGARWISTVNRDTDSQLKMTLCLFPYKGGYHVDMYAVLVKEEGGVNPMAFARGVARTMVGSPEQWTEKVFLDTIKQVSTTEATSNAKISFLEGYPKQTGTPWLATKVESIIK